MAELIAAPGAATENSIIGFPKKIGEWLLWILLVFLTFSLPKPPALELDASWRMALTYFLEHGYGFGRDIIFTYGPLGFLLGRTYTGDLLWMHLAWQLLESVVAASLLINLGRRQTGLDRFFFFAFFVLFGVGYEDALQTILIVLIGWSTLRWLDQEPKLSPTFVPAGFLALLASIKFTNLMLSGVVVVVVCLFGLRRARARPTWIFVGVFTAAFLGIWLACRQPLAILPLYIWYSLDVSAGYQATMGLPTPPEALWKALTMLGLLSGYVAWHLSTQRDRRRSIAGFVILSAFLYLNWKHGFVRADGHMLGFFYSGLLISLGFPALFDDTGRRVWVARVFLIPVSLLGIWGVRDTLPPVVDYAAGIAQEKVVKNLKALFHWSTVQQDLENQLTMQRKAADLPKTRAAIGRSTLDVLGFEQAVAILNQFNYSARPVFQSYTAYTPRLAALNAAFIASPRAPEYMLVKLETIDERPLMLDDASLLQLFPHFYRFVLKENGYQLWRRRPAPPSAEQLVPRALTRLTVPLGTRSALGEFQTTPLWVQMDLAPSLLGRLRNLLYKPPIIHLKLTDNDGKEVVYRLPLMEAQSGFMLNPLITDIDGFIESQGGHPRRWVRDFKLEVEPTETRYFAKDAIVTLSAITPSKAKSEYDQQMIRAKYSMFSLIPDEATAFTEPSQIEIDGHVGLVMHAPSLMVFTLPPGVRHAAGSFGYPPNAYSNGGHTDGAEFRVIWVSETERRMLFSRLITPAERPKDRGWQHFDVDLSKLPAGGQLQLQITPGPHDEHSWDWTAWADVEIK